MGCAWARWRAERDNYGAVRLNPGRRRQRKTPAVTPARLHSASEGMLRRIFEINSSAYLLVRRRVLGAALCYGHLPCRRVNVWRLGC